MYVSTTYVNIPHFRYKAVCNSYTSSSVWHGTTLDSRYSNTILNTQLKCTKPSGMIENDITKLLVEKAKCSNTSG